MAIVNRILPTFNGYTRVPQQINPPVVDDIFDPLFNKTVKDYYNQTYGNPFLGTMAGYAAMFDNALTGRKGILGPGMGILSTFGRSMDKADDFILGGLTEGVNALGQLTGGTNQAPQNPIANIFVNDYDYQGVNLMAAAGNAMARLAGTQTPLDASDFQSFGDKAAGTLIDLATDPGIMGGQLARLNKGTAVGNVGQALSNYDDLMADIAGNMAFPGGKALVGKTLERFRNALASSSSRHLQDAVIKQPTEDEINFSNNIYDMSTDLVDTYNINYLDDPEIMAVYEDISKATAPVETATDNSELILDNMFDNVSKDLENVVKQKQDLLPKAKKEYMDDISNVPNNIANKYFDINRYTQSSLDNISEDMSDSEILDVIENVFGDESVQADTIRHYMSDLDTYPPGTVYDKAQKYLTKNVQKISPYKFTPRLSEFHAKVGPLNYKIISDHVQKFLIQHPELVLKGDKNKLLNVEGLEQALNLGEQQFPNDFFNVLSSRFKKGKYHKEISKFDGSTYKRIGIDDYNDFLNLFYKRSNLATSDIVDTFTESGLIPFVRRNEIALSKTQTGRDLIDMAENIYDDVFKDSYIYDQFDDYATKTSEEFNFTEDLNKMFASERLINPASFSETEQNFIDIARNFKKQQLYVNPAITDPALRKYYQQYLDDFYTPTVKKMRDELDAETRKNNVFKITFSTIADDLKKSQSDSLNILKDTLTKATPEETAEAVLEAKPAQFYQAENIYTEVFDDFASRFNLLSLNPDEWKPYIKSLGTPNEKRLFQMINAARTTSVLNTNKIRQGVTELPRFKELKQEAIDLQKKYSPEQVREYLTLKSKMDDVVIEGKDMLSYLIGSGGRAGIKFKLTEQNTKQYKALYDTLTNNVKLINSKADGEILEVVSKRLKDGSSYIGYRFKVSNINIKKDINKIYNMLNSDLELAPLVFQTGDKTLDISKYNDLENFFGRSGMQGLSEDLATKMGFNNLDENYIKYAMIDDPKNTFWKNLNSELGFNEEAMSKVMDSLYNLDFVDRGQFGALRLNRANLGTFDQYIGGFSDDLRFIHSSTFTKGMLDNVNSQTFYELFLTDNFKINQNFQDVATLKNTLFAKNDAGKYTGNLTNLDLVTPKYDSTGKLIGFKKYNKFVDAELSEAFADNNAVLLPSDITGKLDSICKKNKKMSSRVYRFINKYLTVPFKFGTLANVGFLSGNIQDAYFKQALEMSTKYGTTLSDELSEVAMSMRETVILKNQFADAFENFKLFLKSDEAKNNDVFRKFTSENYPVTIQNILGKPDGLKAWTAYVNKLSSDNPDYRIAKLYTFINNYNNIKSFKNNNLDLEDLRDLVNTNEYNVPLNKVEQLFYGNPNGKGFRAYGLFLNNPVSNKILNSSEEIEDLMRTTAIINDLKHNGYSRDKINDILGIPISLEKQKYETLKIDMENALNTMYASNFNYNTSSEIVDKVSYILPFPTFYLKNLGYWANVLTENPQAIDNIISTHEGLWAGKDTSDEFTAQAKGRGAVPIGQQRTPLTKHLTGIVKQTPYNSMFGAFNSINDFKKDFTYRTNPVLRPVTRHLMDYEDVKYRPYSFDQYEKNIKQNDSKWSTLKYMFHQLNPYERTLNTYLRTPGKVKNNNEQLSDFLPSIFQPDFSKKSSK
jgi:hypothetical protein